MDQLILLFFANFFVQTPTFPTDFNNYQIFENVQFEVKDSDFLTSYSDQVKDFIIDKQPNDKPKEQLDDHLNVLAIEVAESRSPEAESASLPAQTQNQENSKITPISDVITQSATKYPWIINPTDKLTFDPTSFRPNKNENYLETELRFADDNPILNRFTFANFPKDNQFYWVLDGNTVVIETQGFQGGLLYQGKSRDTQLTQTATVEQSLWGLQFISALPTNFEELVGDVEVNDLTVRVISGELRTPQGIRAGEVIINSGIDPDDPNVTVLENRVINLGSGSTLNSSGGGSLFQFLDADNAPQILQGYPTTNLQPLLDNGNVKLEEGEIIPQEALQAAGITWGDPLTGEGLNFTAPSTSIPGVKIAQPGGGMTNDLLNLSVNPFLTEEERDFHYLNSLHWIPLGQRATEVDLNLDSQDSKHWYRFYISKSHNRSLIQYDPVDISASYSSIFSNPGISLTLSFDGDLDSNQIANATLGMVLGIVFEFIDFNNIDNSIKDARQKFDNNEEFARLQTKATPQQRRQINQRLNQTLANTNRSSRLNQVSGRVTFPSQITPNHSRIVQLRTGNHQRAIDFIQRDISDWDQGDTSFSELRLSNQDFGPLGFIAGVVPLNNTAITPSNQSSAVDVILTSPDGRQFVQQFRSFDNTVVPINSGRAFDIAFDRITLTQTSQRSIRDKTFAGYVSLPTIEVLVAGTSENFNYGVSLGGWFNLAPNSAPGVGENNPSDVSDDNGFTKEPTVGVYSHAQVNWINRHVAVDSTNKPIAIITHVPFFSINWNSSANRLNPFQITAAYSFSRQGKSVGYSVTPAILYTPEGLNAFMPENSQGEVVGYVTGDLGTVGGLKSNLNLEIGRKVFYDVELSQRVIENFSLGAFVRNFTTTNVGLDSRVSGFNYGAILRYHSDNGLFIDAKLGTGDEGFDARVEAGAQFKF
ncbi:hypothetical protein [Moorena sp. SIO3H5]|uniref:hypothetical protein n=1 Tax=Moorena sp. SIO3H5 TaxID=2607834 RepID=UPI0013B8FB85|nr:hypothetical protein [Moorena sp. SIO3H5]NEO73202.1 hypothetical protein [Moorena sp. SIO3H5]